MQDKNEDLRKKIGLEIVNILDTNNITERVVNLIEVL